MRVWLVEWVFGKYHKILEMEDDRVIYENELGKRLRVERGIRTAEELWEKYGGRFNPYLFADMSREDYEKYRKIKGYEKRGLDGEGLSLLKLLFHEIHYYSPIPL